MTLRSWSLSLPPCSHPEREREREREREKGVGTKKKKSKWLVTQKGLVFVDTRQVLVKHMEQKEQEKMRGREGYVKHELITLYMCIVK